jgi:large subunit ribosomal protein L3
MIDGGRVFHQQSFDLDKYLYDVKGYTDAEVQQLERDGKLVALLSNKKIATGKVIPEDVKTGWKRGISKRTGLLVRKIGMKTEVDFWGRGQPVTVLQVQDNHVVQIKTKEKDGYTALQIGAGLAKLNKISYQMKGHFANAGVPPKDRLVEFRVTEDAMLPPGTKLVAQHFLTGQFVNVSAISKGKGFQGVMKRWGFKGGPATHGASKFHRKAGSTGQRQDPGKVFKGRKMPGHMGASRVTVKRLRVMRVNVDDQLIMVKGAVPGPKKAWVEIYDTPDRPHNRPPPFPTFIEGSKKLPSVLRWKFKDPFWKNRTTDWEMKFAEALKAIKSAQQAGELEGDDAGADKGGEGEKA